ncbi:MAG: hypothetical protein LE168_00990, partial [Endomicrobium sp.]|nr:hypothetical protein [Endomicrobium sp.]
MPVSSESIRIALKSVSDNMSLSPPQPFPTHLRFTSCFLVIRGYGLVAVTVPVPLPLESVAAPVGVVDDDELPPGGITAGAAAFGFGPAVVFGFESDDVAVAVVFGFESDDVAVAVVFGFGSGGVDDDDEKKLRTCFTLLPIQVSLLPLSATVVSGVDDELLLTPGG